MIDDCIGVDLVVSYKICGSSEPVDFYRCDNSKSDSIGEPLLPFKIFLGDPFDHPLNDVRAE